MKTYIIIKADTNDADYVSEKNEISKENLEIITPVIAAIKEFNEDKSIKYQKYNWWNIEGRDTKPQFLSPKERYVDSGKCSQKALDYFYQYCPSGGENGVHSIESIELLEVVNEIKLL